MKTKLGWTLTIAAVLVSWGVLSFYERSSAAPQGARVPFANAVEQRNEIVRELREIKLLLKEQNKILRAAAAEEPARP